MGWTWFALIKFQETPRVFLRVLAIHVKKPSCFSFIKSWMEAAWKRLRPDLSEWHWNTMDFRRGSRAARPPRSSFVQRWSRAIVNAESIVYCLPALSPLSRAALVAICIRGEVGVRERKAALRPLLWSAADAMRGISRISGRVSAMARLRGDRARLNFRVVFGMGSVYNEIVTNRFRSSLWKDEHTLSLSHTHLLPSLSCVVHKAHEETLPALGTGAHTRALEAPPNPEADWSKRESVTSAAAANSRLRPTPTRAEATRLAGPVW